MFNKLKQFKDLRDEAKKLQNTLSQETLHHDEMGGKLNIVIDGNLEVLSIDIAEELLSPTEKQKLEKGIGDLVNGAVKKMQRKVAMKMQKESGMDLSSLLKKEKE